MSNEVFPINDLPEEVLEHIFSFLPLSDRKSASLVCTTWEKLAFSRRFLREVVFQIGSQETLLHKSKRRYSNMSVIFDKHVVHNHFFYKHLFKLLELFATDVESLHCRGYVSTKLLCMMVNRLPKLQQWTVESEVTNWYRGPRFPVVMQLPAPGSLNNELQIEMPNLTQLSIRFTNPANGWDPTAVLRQLAPQLKKVDLYSTVRSIPLEQLQFLKAEVLKIGGSLCVTDNDSDLRIFFAGFRLLKETLGLGQVYEVSENSLKCNPLVTVKNLSLELSECEDSSIERLRHLLPNVIAMDVVTLKDDWTFERGLRHICRNFRGLQRLEVSDRPTRNRKLESGLLVLEHLDQLEELIFKDIHTRIVNIPPNPLLKRFVMNYPEQLSNGDLLELARQYPNLELGPDRQVTSEGIAAFKSQLVNCAVHCVPSDTILSRVLANNR
ncbi:uncharacterized protein LOC134292027 [Aedes albopictus]|uniref:F-box domain-containing protein n=1 Tax=Aedes albopictus TaxID=7160 RepID=A0ABM1YHA0_AEDAL